MPNDEVSSRRGEACPLPLTHDRLEEAHWHLHQMIFAYHHPQPFRFSANAFIHTLKSVVEMLRIDLERIQENAWRKARVEELKENPLVSSFFLGRDIIVHRGSLINSSTVEIALFKYRKVKLGLVRDIKSDRPTKDLLIQAQQADFFKMIIDPERSAIGEQLGVRRLYREPKLSDEMDVLTASDTAWRHVQEILKDAHEHLGIEFDAYEADCIPMHSVGNHESLLETDVDPALVEKWGWN
ncbi:hypothetical protein ACYAFX_28625 (plasmid) [Rhodococcus aetherivorans]